MSCPRYSEVDTRFSEVDTTIPVFDCAAALCTVQNKLLVISKSTQIDTYYAFGSLKTNGDLSFHAERRLVGLLR
jgi:hypothetical protein